MTSSVLALFVVMATAGQAATTVAVPAGRKYGLDRPVKLQFEVPTSVGMIKGTVKLVRLEARALDGGGRLDLRGTVDPNSADVGDDVLSGHIARWVLRGAAGPIIFGSSKRLPPLTDAGQGGGKDAGLWGTGLYLDARRGGRYLEVRYAFTPDQAGGDLGVRTEIPLAELGLKTPKHPFIEVTGPVTLSLQARLVRR